MSRDGHEIPAAARELAQRGELLAALKSAKEKSGRGLKDAQTAVAATTRAPGVRPRSTGEDRSSAPDDLPRQALAALKSGSMMEAIKHTRGHHPGLGLKDAKETVERYLERDADTRAKFKAASAAKFKRTALSLLLVLIALSLVAVATIFFTGSIK